MVTLGPAAAKDDPPSALRAWIDELVPLQRGFGKAMNAGGKPMYPNSRNWPIASIVTKVLRQLLEHGSYEWKEGASTRILVALHVIYKRLPNGTLAAFSLLGVGAVRDLSPQALLLSNYVAPQFRSSAGALEPLIGKLIYAQALFLAELGIECSLPVCQKQPPSPVVLPLPPFFASAAPFHLLCTAPHRCRSASTRSC